MSGATGGKFYLVLPEKDCDCGKKVG